MNGFGQLIPRILTAVVLAIGFLFMASVFAPSRSQAEFTNPADNASSLSQSSSQFLADHSATPFNGITSLGRIEGTKYSVEIFATPIGPRYSVWGLDGQELATLMTHKQVSNYFGEDLPLPDLQALSPLQLMHAEPIHADW